MESNKTFIRYYTFDSRESVTEYINDDCVLISNYDDHLSMIEMLICYKDSHLNNYSKRRNGSSYRNVYAHGLTVAIPLEIKEDRYNEFVEKYIRSIDQRFKALLWVYKIKRAGNGVYAEIMLFSRYVYKNERKVNDRYNQDYYYDSKTGKRCRKDHPNAILKAKKGSCKIDENGSPIMKLRSVKEVEERVFKFRNFNKYMKKLKKKLLIVAMKFSSAIEFNRTISKHTIKDEYGNPVKKAMRVINRKIDKINDVLLQYQDSIRKGKIDQTDPEIFPLFNLMLRNIDNLIHVEKTMDYEGLHNRMKDWWKSNVVGEMA